MNGIYFSTMCNISDEKDTAYPGIRDKIRKQINCFEEAGNTVYFFYANNHNYKKLDRLLLRLPFYETEYRIDYAIAQNTDFLYIRKPSFINMGMITFLKNLKRQNPSIKLVMEIPTYPYDKEYSQISKMPFIVQDKISRFYLRKYLDAIVTYSNDNYIFGVKCINISNGVDTKRIFLSVKNSGIEKLSNKEEDSIHIMICASFTYWHGYDRAIEGLRVYKEKYNKLPGVVLEFVGDGPELPKYKAMVSKYSLDPIVNFHGKLIGNELTRMYCICDMAFDSMGRHRAGVKYNSSLKGKEYCAYGLPIVSGVETELDSDNTFRFYYRIPADDSPICYEEIVNWYHSLFDSEIEKLEMKNSIIEYAEEHFDFKTTFQPVIDFVQS